MSVNQRSVESFNSSLGSSRAYERAMSANVHMSGLDEMIALDTCHLQLATVHFTPLHLSAADRRPVI